jgi:probable HAF family extracellular repeat protein
LLLLLIGFLALASVASSVGATQPQPRWVIRDLGTFKAESTEAVAINNRGQVVAYTFSRAHAFLWENGKVRNLGEPRWVLH